ncbi:MAG: hypothetical protein JSU63_06990 [Phycisphaerales bacterium]|nr:MAG: hypothetical protein JSU63_06990 [Phycisphaerales bacterium]
MKLIPRQKIWLTIVIVVNLALWIIPSDVVEQIARDRHTMLGRYSRTHFSWILGVLVISAISFYVDWSTGETYKRRWFKVIAALLVAMPALGVIDFLLRTPEAAHYVKDQVAYHRPVNASFDAVYEDKPEAYRTYPNAPAGYGTTRCSLTTDKHGFRNRTADDQYDIVVLGDSFAEGSNVSDEHVWPVLLGERSRLSVYNLGMSGYEPLHYLESLRHYALKFKPRYVLCLLYEGNDFRSAKADRKRLKPSFSKRLKVYLKRSPIINGIDRAMIDTLGPVNSRGRVNGVEILNWLPLAIPPGPKAKYYAFAPKQLRDMYQTNEGFSQDRHWLNPRSQLGQMSELCSEAGCQLVVVFAPTKAHVTLPAMADSLPAGNVRAFMALRYRKPLPEPGAFLESLCEGADARESVVGDWCKKQGIPFLSLTSALRSSAVAGRQVYYTYDQHWTPAGHEVVAEAISEYLAEHPLFGSNEALPLQVRQSD